MTAKRTFLALLAGGAAVLASAALAAPASAPAHASILIRHQVRGCHSWSVNGGTFAPSQKVVLRRSGTITITNTDMMPHKLVQLSGPAVHIVNLRTAAGLGSHGSEAPGTMGHMGAKTKVAFSTAGTYRFTTKAGEDYMPMKTVGEDNVLKLTVKVI